MMREKRESKNNIYKKTLNYSYCCCNRYLKKKIHIQVKQIIYSSFFYLLYNRRILINLVYLFVK